MSGRFGLSFSSVARRETQLSVVSVSHSDLACEALDPYLSRPVDPSSTVSVRIQEDRRDGKGVLPSKTCRFGTPDNGRRRV